ADRELAALRRQLERLQQEVNRQQTLLRLARRTIGLPPPRAAVDRPGGKDKGKRRQRHPVVRALRAAEALHRRGPRGGGGRAARPRRPQRRRCRTTAKGVRTRGEGGGSGSPPSPSFTEETVMRGRTPSGPECVEQLPGSDKARQRVRVILETMTGALRVQEAC